MIRVKSGFKDIKHEIINLKNVLLKRLQGEKVRLNRKLTEKAFKIPKILKIPCINIIILVTLK